MRLGASFKVSEAEVVQGVAGDKETVEALTRRVDEVLQEAHAERLREKQKEQNDGGGGGAGGKSHKKQGGGGKKNKGKNVEEIVDVE